MLTRLYLDAVMADPDIAFRVWLLWNAGEIDDELAAIAWRLLAEHGS